MASPKENQIQTNMTIKVTKKGRATLLNQPRGITNKVVQLITGNSMTLHHKTRVEKRKLENEKEKLSGSRLTTGNILRREEEIDRQIKRLDENDKCRLCDHNQETTRHLLLECAQTEIIHIQEPADLEDIIKAAKYETLHALLAKPQTGIG